MQKRVAPASFAARASASTASTAISFSALDAGLVMRALRAIGAVLRAAAGLDRQQRRELHLARVEVPRCTLLRAEHQFGERQVEQRAHFRARPVVAERGEGGRVVHVVCQCHGRTLACRTQRAIARNLHVRACYTDSLETFACSGSRQSPPLTGSDILRHVPSAGYGIRSLSMEFAAMLTRRLFVGGLGTVGAGLTAASAQHAGHDPMYSHLRDTGVTGPPADVLDAQRVFDTPAPRAANQGRWITRAPLPLPRSEMAWATVLGNRMHIVGGYGEQRVDRPYHHAYDPASDRWINAPLLPRGANHVGVTVLDGKLLAIGGHLDQNRRPDALCFVLDGETWRPIAPLPKAAGAIGCVAAGGVLHAVGGAVGETTAAKLSLDWHLVYDPKADAWAARAPLPTARDHIGIVEIGGLIHVAGGRVNNFYTNSHCITPMTPRATYGSRARRCRPPAPGTAPCSIVEGFSSWAAKARTACSGRMKLTIRQATMGSLRADADAAPRPWRGRDRRCDLRGGRWPGHGRRGADRHP